jgi:hypothetical protein
MAARQLGGILQTVFFHTMLPTSVPNKSICNGPFTAKNSLK